MVEYKAGARRGFDCRVSGCAHIAALIISLVMVSTLGFWVGASTEDPSQTRDLEQRVLRVSALNAERARRCEAALDLLSHGDTDANGAMQALASDVNMTALLVGTERERNAATRQLLQSCRDNVNELRIQINGADVANITQHVEQLRQMKDLLEGQLNAIRQALQDTTGSVVPHHVQLKQQYMALMAELYNISHQQEQDAHCHAAKDRFSVVFDIGSTGNRVHVFRFTSSESAHAQHRDDAHSGLDLASLDLQEELFKENLDALSKIASPELAATKLDALYEDALSFIPAHLHACSPTEFKATAGLRKIGQANAGRILDAIHTRFRPRGLWLKGHDPVRILEGREEGPFAWVTVNFLLGSLAPTNNNNKKKEVGTAAIIDLGGGSTQLVFEPTNTAAFLAAAPPDYVYRAHLGQRTLVAYQRSHEGFGLHEGVKKLLGGEDDAATESPCYYRNASGADFDGCVRAFTPIVRGNTSPHGGDGALDHQPSTRTCTFTECGVAGAFQPSLSTQFSGPVYAFSFIYDLMRGKSVRELVKAKTPENPAEMNLADMHEIGQRMCQIDPSTLTKQSSLVPQRMCAYYAFVYALLRDGYGVDENRTLIVEKKIRGFETAWALGAGLSTMAS